MLWIGFGEQEQSDFVTTLKGLKIDVDGRTIFKLKQQSVLMVFVRPTILCVNISSPLLHNLFGKRNFSFLAIFFHLLRNSFIDFKCARFLGVEVFAFFLERILFEQDLL